MKGDLTLVDEILNRIQNPQDLTDLEEMIRLRCQQAYGSELPNGTLGNPLDKEQITPEIKIGYGWKDKTEEMTNLLVQLASYVGMVIQRDSPHRSYGDGTGKVKSRRISLVLSALKSQHILHIYHFENTYIDDKDVVDNFKTRACPELAYRDFNLDNNKCVVAHLVSPGGITRAGIERLQECQRDLDIKYKGAIKLDAMRLDELVWGEMYPAIQERYQDSSGKFGTHNINLKIKKLCKQLCDQTSHFKALKPSSKSNNINENQLSLFGELFSGSQVDCNQVKH